MADNATATPRTIQRTDDYHEVYANSIHLESSFWDLKLLLGRLDQSGEVAVTRQFLGVSLPWAQVKLLAHHLHVNIAIHEIYNGPITLRNDILPQIPQGTEDQMKDPLFKAAVEKITELHKQLLMSFQNVEAPKR